MTTSPFRFRAIALALLCAFLSTGICFAQEEKEEEVPQLGNIGGSIQSSGTSNKNAIDYVGSSDFGESANVISGSMLRQGPNKWLMKIFNNSEENSYRVSVNVEMYDKRENRIGTQSYSYTLKAGERYERPINVSPMVANCLLNLTSAKNVTPPKKKEAKDGEKDATGAGNTPG